MSAAGYDLNRLAGLITGRETPVFTQAWDLMSDQLAEAFTGRTILVTGGGGFIAGQALRLLLPLRPAKVVIVDDAEHGMAELVRDLRSAGLIRPGTAFEPRLVDVRTPLAAALVAAEGPFDALLAFAAAKHVRSERDACSALHMLDVNINGTTAMADAVAASNPAARLFVVSTDKAASPSSLMGASKRAMEAAVLGRYPQATTTRFANVAFSSGSLLESWLIRLGRGQALPVPAETARFFVSPTEAGRLCVLASVAPGGGVVIPAPGTVEQTDLQAALIRLLDGLGRPYRIVTDEADLHRHADRVEVLLTPRDTAGEKSAEVFVGVDETSRPWLPGIDLAVTDHDVAAARGLGEWVRSEPQGGVLPSLTQILDRVASSVGSFHHIASEKRLDDRI